MRSAAEAYAASCKEDKSNHAHADQQMDGPNKTHRHVCHPAIQSFTPKQLEHAMCCVACATNAMHLLHLNSKILKKKKREENQLTRTKRLHEIGGVSNLPEPWPPELLCLLGWSWSW